MIRRCTSAALVLVAVAALFVTGAASEAKAKIVDVQAGAFHPTNKEAPYEYTRFYPDTVKVHPGQTVRWQILGFHTVTFSKTPRDGFFRADELPGAYAIPERSVLGSGCGRPAAQPCVVKNRNTFAGSAAPLFSGDPVHVRFDAPPGKYAYYCQIHAKMQGVVEVVPRSAPVATPQQIKAQIASAVKRDSAAIDRVYKAAQRPTSKVDADGVRTWLVRPGVETADSHAQVVGYVPNELPIAAGDRVRFEMGDTFLGDPHTVTFPKELVGDFAPIPHGLFPFALTPSCDADDPTSGAPGVLGQWGFLGPPCPASLELVWGAWMTNANTAPGNIVLTPATYHDSGILAAKRLPASFRTPPGGQPLPSRLDAEFPAPGTYTYACNVHGPFMTGTINVS
jgi:plastocyanin